MRVALDDLGHRFGEGPWLFRGVTHEFLPGEVYALVGPSGSGKSTLLSIIAGWIDPAQGSLDRDPDAPIAWVPQNPHGVARRNAIDHVALPALARGLTITEATAHAAELLRRFNLAHTAERPFSALSGGEAQRLMLARALAARPQLLLVDEPTAQLDRKTAAEVDAVLSALADDGLIVIVATHDAQTRAACTAVLDLEEHVA